MDKLIGICGLNCEQCDARIATVNDDNELREKTAKLWGSLNGISEITAEHINCMGCRAEGVKTVYCDQMCEIRKCSLSRGYDTCAECPDIDTCKIVAPVFENAPQARENLK